MHHETLRQPIEIPNLSFSTTPGSCHGFVLECGYSITGESIKHGNPVVLIPDMIEAAIYRGVQQIVTFCSKSQRDVQLLGKGI